jgi:cyclic pyranopterin phosphate synthase
MVDVTPKEATHRRAMARCRVFMLPETTSKVASNAITKGDVLGAARIAGIQASKRTSDMIPLCHPLLLGAVNINFTIGDDYVEVESQVETIDRTGVEMEAMTACALAALTIYDARQHSVRSATSGDGRLGTGGHRRRSGGRSARPVASRRPVVTVGERPNRLWRKREIRTSFARVLNAADRRSRHRTPHTGPAR